MKPFERNQTLTKAYELAIEEVKQAGLTAKVKTHDKDKLIFSVCELYANDKKVCQGLGKGMSASPATVGAIFESLEHYYCQTFSEIEPEYHEYKQINQLPEAIKQDYVIDFISKEDPQSIYPCTQYKNIQTNETLDYPVELTFPESLSTNDYRNTLLKYSSGNGRSIGTNYNEALLHGLNEIIERQAISYFLIHHFILNPNTPITVTKNESLPIYIQQKIRLAEDKYGIEIAVIKLKHFFNSHVYLAIPLNGSFTYIHTCGAGSSLSEEVACQRAVSELIQCLHPLTAEMKADKFREYQEINEVSSQLANCYAIKLQNKKIVYENYANSHITALTIIDQLKIIKDNFYEQRYSILVKIIHESDNCCCLSIVVPNMSRFHLITSANVVLPSMSCIEDTKLVYQENLVVS
ncbi:YcaO-like family protein [Francisellaceae bacterium]|nr:YcaO-like family protein [Francisellaceae bacterium]